LLINRDLPLNFKQPYQRAVHPLWQGQMGPLNGARRLLVSRMFADGRHLPLVYGSCRKLKLAHRLAKPAVVSSEKRSIFLSLDCCCAEVAPFWVLFHIVKLECWTCRSKIGGRGPFSNCRWCRWQVARQFDFVRARLGFENAASQRKAS
jgi:hypothetical protein